MSLFNPIYDLDHIFTYHPPKDDQPEKYVKIREAAKEFAKIILENTPYSADQSFCIRKIREVTMTANASVALDGRLFKEEKEGKK